MQLPLFLMLAQKIKKMKTEYVGGRGDEEFMFA